MAAPATLVPGRSLPLQVEIPPPLRTLAGPVRRAEVLVALPPSFDVARVLPVLVVSATSDPGHQSSRRLLEAYRAAAAEAGWVALAVDPGSEVAPHDDRLTLRFALVSTALAALRTLWPAAAGSPLAFAGFSGGAKYAGWLAALCAAQHERIAGVFLAGVNEEPVAAAARRVGVLDARFLAVPVFLQSGRHDTVATPEQHRRVADALREAGFPSVRLESVDGGHEVDASRLREALDWFGAIGRQTAAGADRP